MDARALIPALVLTLATHVLPTVCAAEAVEQGRDLVLLPVPFYTLDTGYAGSLIGMFWERGEDARADVAFTEEGTAVYLTLGEAF